MVSQVLTRSTQLSPTFAGSRVRLNDKVSKHVEHDQFVETFSKDTDNAFDIDRVYDAKLPFAESDETAYIRHESIETPLFSGPHTPRRPDLDTPLILSPTSSASTSSSSGTDTRIWDSPCTPLRQLDHPAFDVPTPSTPPGTFKGTLSTNRRATKTSPSRISATDEESNAIKQKQDVESFESNIRDFQTMLKSSKS